MWKVKLWVGVGAVTGLFAPILGCVLGEKYRKDLNYRGHLNGREMIWCWGSIVSMSLGMVIGGVTATYLFEDKDISEEMKAQIMLGVTNLFGGLILTSSMLYPWLLV